MIWNFYKKISIYRTPTKHWITLRQRIVLHISNHRGDKYWRSTDRKKVQLAYICWKQRTCSCRVMNEEDRRAGS